MEKVALADLEPVEAGTGVRRELADELDTSAVAINHYELDDGGRFPGGLHAHADQEEVFVVLEGEATFETMDGEVTVVEGEAIRFALGEFQSGRNGGAEPLVAIAIGAPRDSEDVRIPYPCPACSHDDMRLETAGHGVVFTCPDCGAQRTPRPCPECRREELRFTLDEELEPAVRCPDCGSEFADPPLEEGP